MPGVQGPSRQVACAGKREQQTENPNCTVGKFALQSKTPRSITARDGRPIALFLKTATLGKRARQVGCLEKVSLLQSCWECCAAPLAQQHTRQARGDNGHERTGSLAGCVLHKYASVAWLFACSTSTKLCTDLLARALLLGCSLAKHTLTMAQAAWQQAMRPWHDATPTWDAFHVLPTQWLCPKGSQQCMPCMGHMHCNLQFEKVITIGRACSPFLAALPNACCPFQQTVTRQSAAQTWNCQSRFHTPLL